LEFEILEHNTTNTSGRSQHQVVHIQKIALKLKLK